jgi:hypothetical protein
MLPIPPIPPVLPVLVEALTALAVTADGIKLMPSRVPLAGRAACTFDTVQTSAKDAELTDAARLAATAVRAR